jgi:signal transduction histidine kinase
MNPSDFDLMAERIESLVTGHKRLLGDVSHELRSPLSRLVVALGLVKQGSREEIPEHLERIAVEARRLDKLIGQLLTLSRIDSGVHTREGSSFDLTNLVHEVVSDADFEARSRVRRVVVTSADECIVTGSEELLRSAVENVVRNAVRFTREDTSVRSRFTGRKAKLYCACAITAPACLKTCLRRYFFPSGGFNQPSKQPTMAPALVLPSPSAPSTFTADEFAP